MMTLPPVHNKPDSGWYDNHKCLLVVGCQPSHLPLCELFGCDDLDLHILVTFQASPHTEHALAS
jgi:hypothetical protein